ncbi:hypothetical protein A2U01_0012072, partial [Trifolium medium]|nr:hypothetical protein [Trifolium medium]
MTWSIHIPSERRFSHLTVNLRLCRASSPMAGQTHWAKGTRPVHNPPSIRPRMGCSALKRSELAKPPLLSCLFAYLLMTSLATHHFSRLMITEIYVNPPNFAINRTLRVAALVATLKDLLQEDFSYVVEDLGAVEPFFEAIEGLQGLSTHLSPDQRALLEQTK